MIDYLAVLADFNGKTFPDQVLPYAISNDRVNKAWDKPEESRTAAEQKLVETEDHYIAKLHRMPTNLFIEDSTVEKTFRYIGKGVKLGDGSRIVCWYRLKNTKDARTYRVVYGDLSVKDVAPEDLPLPVPENRETAAFAKTFEQIHKAKTMTWRFVGYEHISTQDGKRTWAHTIIRNNAYKSPGHYRSESLDDNGKVTEIEIKDLPRGRIVTFDLKEKKAFDQGNRARRQRFGAVGVDIQEAQRAQSSMGWKAKDGQRGGQRLSGHVSMVCGEGTRL